MKCHLSRLMGERKLRIADVARGARVQRNLVTLLYYERAKRVDFASLERLCRFFEVGVGEFLELSPSTKRGGEKPAQPGRRSTR